MRSAEEVKWMNVNCSANETINDVEDRLYISVVLCAVSSTKTWVNQPLTSVHTGMAKGYHLYTLLDLGLRGTFLYCICYGIAEQY